MKKDQFFGKFQNLKISQAELERKWQSHLREQKELQMLYEAAQRQQGQSSPPGAAAGGAAGGADGLQLVWDDIANAPVADAESVSDWNDLFGDPVFSAVSVAGDIVSLTPVNVVQFPDNVFSPGKAGNQGLLQIIDNANCVTSIGSQAVANCHSLTTVILPACTYIGYAAFENSYNIVNVDFSAVEEIAEIGLGDLHALTSLDMPALITAGNSAFYACDSLVSFTAPNLITAVQYCFGGCSSLQTLNLPLLVTAGNDTFRECADLTSFTAPQLLTIGDYAFFNCNSLTSISIPSCTSLGSTVGDNNVFNGISGKTIAVTIPAALMTCNIGDPDGDIQYLVANNTVTGLPVDQCSILTLTGLNATVTANSVTNDNTGGWDSSGYSTQTYTTPVVLKFKTSTNSNILMGGFAYTPTLETDTYLNTTYGIYLTSSQTDYEIYENGNQVYTGSFNTNRSVNDVWKVVYDGTSIKYYQNTTLLYTSTNARTAPLHVFYALNTANQGVTNICAV